MQQEPTLQMAHQCKEKNNSKLRKPTITDVSLIRLSVHFNCNNFKLWDIHNLELTTLQDYSNEKWKEEQDKFNL